MEKIYQNINSNYPLNGRVLHNFYLLSGSFHDFPHSLKLAYIPLFYYITFLFKKRYAERID